MRTIQASRRIAVTVMMLAALLASASPANGERYYSVVDLGTIGGPVSRARAMNDQGDVVGDSTTSDFQYHAFLYSGGLTTDLGTFGGEWSVAYGINNLRHVVGGAAVSQYEAHPFLYDGTMHDLGTFGADSAGATAINDAGQILVSLPNETNDPHMILVSGDESVDLGYLQGPTTVTHSHVTYAWALTGGGDVAGYSEIGGAYHAFLWRDGVMTDLGTLGQGDCLTHCRLLIESFAFGMNGQGDVVGQATFGDAIHAFLHRDGQMRDLHQLPGRTASTAASINDAGEIVGTLFPASNVERAFVYRDGVMHDLNDRVWPSSRWILNRAAAINDSGQIAGTGTIRDTIGWPRAFRLDPHDTVCGDGVTEFREECDDGNTVDADGCEADCTLPRCGNAIHDPGEACEDGNLVDGDGCDSNCTPTACGNGIATAGEACDDGAAGSTGCCTASCALIDRDGDGRCDARDVCTNAAPVQDARLVLDADDVFERFVFAGIVRVPNTPPIDPHAHGVRVVLADSTGGAFLDGTADAGDDWTVVRPGREWRYFRPVDGSGPITEARIRRVGPRGRLRFVVRGAQPVTVSPETRFPIVATIAFDTPVAMTGQCGEMRAAMGRRPRRLSK